MKAEETRLDRLRAENEQIRKHLTRSQGAEADVAQLVIRAELAERRLAVAVEALKAISKWSTPDGVTARKTLQRIEEMKP